MNILNSLLHKTCGLFLSISLFFSTAIFAQTCNVNNLALTTPSSDFQPDDRGVVTHNKTGLMWMRCSIGQTWDGKTCSGSVDNYTWQQALQVAEEHNFAGYSDWRLPNKNELASILENNCEQPAINLDIFPGTKAAYYWSSTPFAAFANMAWSVHFNNSFVYYEFKSGPIHVRLVRG